MGLRGTRLSAALVAAAGVAAAAGAQAAEWWLEPMVRGQTFHDDNLRLLTTDEQAVWSVLLEPRLAGGRRIERAGIAFDAGAQFRRYPGDSELDSNDQDLHLDSYYLTERDRFGLDLDFIRDTTLTSELDETGFVQVRRRRTTREASPSWIRSLGARDTLQLSYYYSSVTYDAPVSEFVDYDYQTFAGTWMRRLDAKNQLHFTALYSRFEAPDIDSQTDTVGLQGGLERDFSERTKGTFLAGWRRTDAQFRSFQQFGPFLIPVQAETQSDGGLFSAEIEHRFERAVLKASLSRSIDPGGFGTVYQSDKVRISARFKFTERRRGGFNVYALRNEAVEGGSTARDRTYYRINPFFEWDLSREWRLRGEYMYRWQEYETAQDAADSNRITFTLEYAWPRMAWSR